MFKKPKRPSLIKTNQINTIRQFAEVTIEDSAGRRRKKVKMQHHCAAYSCQFLCDFI